MSDLKSICDKLISSVDKIISVSIIDLADGKTLSDSFAENQKEEELRKNISLSVMEILKSPSAKKVETHLSNQSDKEVKNSFKETFISSTNNFYFLKIVDELDTAIFIITQKTANQGLIWSELKTVVPKIKQIIG